MHVAEMYTLSQNVLTLCGVLSWSYTHARTHTFTEIMSTGRGNVPDFNGSLHLAHSSHLSSVVALSPSP